MTDLLLRIDGKFTSSVFMLMKLSSIKCVLASILRRSLRPGLNNLYWAVCKIIAVTQQIHSPKFVDSWTSDCRSRNFWRETENCIALILSIPCS